MADKVSELQRVGDSSKDVIGNVKRTAMLLLKATQEKKEKHIKLEDLISERDKLVQERIALAAELHLCQELSSAPLADYEDMDEAAMEEKKQQIQTLEEELLAIQLQSLQQKKLLECLHQHEFLMNHLFPEQSGVKEISIQGIASQHSQLVSKLQHNISELQKSKDRLLAIKKDRSAANRQCRELMAKLEDLKFEEQNPPDADGHEQDPDPDSMQQLLNRSRNEATLLKHALLQLIVGSKVDWSRDKELCDLVLKLGRHS